MAKWADYIITHVRYDSDGDRIAAVKRWEDTGDQLANSEEKARRAVVASLERGETYCTAYKNDNDKWVKGDDVETVEVNGTTFIRTDGNKVEADNLGELPQF